MRFELEGSSRNVPTCYKRQTRHGEEAVHFTVSGRRLRIFTDAVAAYRKGFFCFEVDEERPGHHKTEEMFFPHRRYEPRWAYDSPRVIEFCNENGGCNTWLQTTD